MPFLSSFSQIVTLFGFLGILLFASSGQAQNPSLTPAATPSPKYDFSAPMVVASNPSATAPWQYVDDYGNGRTQFGEAPLAATEGTTTFYRLPVTMSAPQSPDKPEYVVKGCEIFSTKYFALSGTSSGDIEANTNGWIFQTRMRVSAKSDNVAIAPANQVPGNSALPKGLVCGFFLYSNQTEWDEIDWEILTKQNLQQIQLVNFNDYIPRKNLPNPNDPSQWQENQGNNHAGYLQYASNVGGTGYNLDWSQWHTVRIVWRPATTVVNGNPVVDNSKSVVEYWIQTPNNGWQLLFVNPYSSPVDNSTNAASNAMSIRLNAWVPESDFSTAYDSNLNVTNGNTYYMDVDYTEVRKITGITPSVMNADVAIPNASYIYGRSTPSLTDTLQITSTGTPLSSLSVFGRLYCNSDWSGLANNRSSQWWNGGSLWQFVSTNHYTPPGATVGNTRSHTFTYPTDLRDGKYTVAAWARDLNCNSDSDVKYKDSDPKNWNRYFILDTVNPTISSSTALTLPANLGDALRLQTSANDSGSGVQNLQIRLKRTNTAQTSNVQYWNSTANSGAGAWQTASTVRTIANPNTVPNPNNGEDFVRNQSFDTQNLGSLAYALPRFDADCQYELQVVTADGVNRTTTLTRTSSNSPSLINDSLVMTAPATTPTGTPLVYASPAGTSKIWTAKWKMPVAPTASEIVRATIRFEGVGTQQPWEILTERFSVTGATAPRFWVLEGDSSTTSTRSDVFNGKTYYGGFLDSQNTGYVRRDGVGDLIASDCVYSVSGDTLTVQVGLQPVATWTGTHDGKLEAATDKDLVGAQQIKAKWNVTSGGSLQGDEGEGSGGFARSPRQGAKGFQLAGWDKNQTRLAQNLPIQQTPEVATSNAASCAVKDWNFNPQTGALEIQWQGEAVPQSALSFKVEGQTVTASPDSASRLGTEQTMLAPLTDTDTNYSRYFLPTSTDATTNAPTNKTGASEMGASETSALPDAAFEAPDWIEVQVAPYTDSLGQDHPATNYLLLLDKTPEQA